jgi:hypothetical protein
VVELAIADVSLRFAPLTVTAQLRISAGLAAPVPSPTPPSDGTPDDPSSTTATAYTWEAVGQGDATIEGELVTQSGWLTIRTPAVPPSGPALAANDATVLGWVGWPRFSERGLAELPLEQIGGGLASDPTGGVLSHLSLVVEATPAATTDLRLRCLLVWTGAVDDALIQAVHERWSAFEWQLLLAWKALGVEQ